MSDIDDLPPFCDFTPDQLAILRGRADFSVEAVEPDIWEAAEDGDYFGAHCAAQAIIHHLSMLDGFRDVLDQVDEDRMAEMEATMTEIVMIALAPTYAEL